MLKRIFLCLILKLVGSLCNDQENAILVDWSLSVIAVEINNFLLTYDPPVGKPPPYTYIGHDIRKLWLKELMPATVYHVSVSIVGSNTVTKIFNETFITAPEIPLINFVHPSVNRAYVSISYFDYEMNNRMSFRVICSPKSIDKSIVAENRTSFRYLETNDTNFYVENLLPNRWYCLSIFSRFMNISSKYPSKYEFRTLKRDKIEVRNGMRSLTMIENDTVLLRDSVGPIITSVVKEGAKLKVEWRNKNDDFECDNYQLISDDDDDKFDKHTIENIRGKKYALISVVNRRLKCQTLYKDSKLISTKLTKHSYHRREIRLKNLNPGQTYKFQLHTVFRNVTSSPVHDAFMTTCLHA
uniref:Uncharacterized protein n=1 Tax=Romanomermis culicivorax TaxID=13658 RepID=A0A915HWH3_ROMCU